jgi:dipeptidyl aminopeptidase/acylaminoacyl peptidase
MRHLSPVASAVGSLLVSAALFPASGFQQTPKLLDMDTYLEMESVGSPRISPDGSHILFTRNSVDKMKDRNQSNLMLMDLESGRIRELTTGGFTVSSPIWSPDGRRIAFLSDRTGTNQIHMMWLDTRETVQLTNLDRAPSDIDWSPDGTRISFTMFIPDTGSPLPIKMPSFPRGAELARPAVVEDRSNWRRDGRGYTPKGNTHIFVVDSELGGTPRQITSGDESYNNPAWAPDGTKLYFSGDLEPEEGYERSNSEIHSIDLATLEITTLTDRLGPDNGPQVSPDGRWIAYTGYDENENYSNLSSLYLMDSTGGNKRMLAGDLPNSPGGITWAPNSSGVYYTMGEEGSSNLYFASRSGEVRKVTDGVHYISGVSIADNGRVAATNSTFYRPDYLVTFDLNRPRELRTLVDYNGDVLDDMKLGEVEEIWTESSDGLRVQGWLMKPAEFEPGRKYPMLLWIHGGPVSMYTVRWNWNWQNFAADGYAVLWMNPRGSTGYGQEFVNGINYLYPGNDFDDLMASVDAAIDRGFIDEDNLFVTGSSGGGVLTAWIVGHTDRFRAAVSQRPVINWHSFVGTTDGDGWYRRFQSFPWEDPVEYAERSPLHYVGNVTTPTMLLSGVEDLRTPIGQAEEFYRALKVLGKETMHVKIPDEYHGSRSVSHRIMTQLYIKAWFDKFKDKPIT